MEADAPRSPERLIAGIPRWRGVDIACTRLPGGSSNRSWLVQAGADTVVLRIDGRRAPPPIVRRERELAILALAARQGLAPEPLHAEPERGILVTRYVPGELVTADDFHDAAILAEFAGLLRRVHALPPCGESCGLAEAGAHYLAAIRSAALLPRAKAVLERLRQAEGSVAVRRTLTHRDPVAGNLIRGEDGLMLIDWEFAVDGDPLFDLAAVVAHHRLSPAAADRLLAAYGDTGYAALVQDLDAMVAAYDALHWLWHAAGGDESPGALAERRAIELRLGL